MTTYRGQHTGIARSRHGSVFLGLPVTVYAAGTTNLATVYRDRTGATVENNPVITDGRTGQYGFYAAPGLYDLLMPDGLTLEDIPVQPDADEGELVVDRAEVVATFTLAGGLTAGAKPARVPAAAAYVLTGVRLAVGTAPVGAAILVDVNKAGTTVFTTQANRPTIADGATSGGPGTAPDVTVLAAGDLLHIDVDQVGSGTAGSDLTVAVLGRRVYA